MRVANVQDALAHLLAENGSGAQATTVYDPATIRVHVRHEGDVNVLEAVDAKHRDAFPIVTVTAIDARSNQSDVDALASDWQIVLQPALVRALEIRQPASEHRSMQRVIRLAIILLVSTLVVFVVARALWRRAAALEDEVNMRSVAQK